MDHILSSDVLAVHDKLLSISLCGRDMHAFLEVEDTGFYAWSILNLER